MYPEGLTVEPFSHLGEHSVVLRGILLAMEYSPTDIRVPELDPDCTVSAAGSLAVAEGGFFIQMGTFLSTISGGTPLQRSQTSSHIWANLLWLYSIHVLILYLSCGA